MKQWIALGACVTATAGMLLSSGVQAGDDDKSVPNCGTKRGRGRSDHLRERRRRDARQGRAQAEQVRRRGLLPRLPRAHQQRSLERKGLQGRSQASTNTWFVSADGHLAETGQTHGHHDGDLPSPLVASDDTTRLPFTTDRPDPDDL